MRTWSCQCGNQLFFDNSQCLQCLATVGWCPRCAAMVSLRPGTVENTWICGNQACGAVLVKCHNYAVEGVCNRMAPAPPVPNGLPLCNCCRYNRVIPDLSIPGNREHWAALEKAKRRLFYTLDLLGLPHGLESEGFRVPLSFSFMADELPDAGLWRPTGDGDGRVYTGHERGQITINLKESDDVERERLRQDLNESHRTLIGHFRHEIGHYYWELLVHDQDETAFVQCFGDPSNPPYGEALEAYYQQGAPANWPQQFISAYASMHPWEDFAETFAFYLDLVSVLDTASHMAIGHAENDGTLNSMLVAFRRVGLAVNELNREMGLLDLVPETVTQGVQGKLGYVHALVARQQG